MRLWAGALALICVAAGPAAGQTDRARNAYEEEIRLRLDQQLPSGRDIGPDGGGWFTFGLFRYDDASADRVRTLRQYQLRAWGSFSVQGAHRFYARGLMGYDDWNAGTNPTERHGDQFTGLELERAWYQFDLGKAIRAATGQEPPVNVRVKAGREFAEIGTALTLSMPLDMVQIETAIGDWQFMGLLGKTLHDTRNIDDSPLVSDHQERCLWGVQARYGGIRDHRPFAYFLCNDDHTHPDQPDPNQAYQYSSRYIGVGSEGTILSPNLRYQLELVGELGSTYSRQTRGERDDICAMAADALLEYLFPLPTRPRLTYEYLWGSGDRDRLLSATATAYGNRPGTRDNAFNAFGFRDTGLAFAPRLANLHIHSLGASFFPLEQVEAFRRMEVGAKVFFYHDSDRTGPISDATATTRSRWVGWEWDVYVNWRITSDLSWTIRYGAFRPGAAFDDDACRQFFLTAAILSF